MHPITHLLASWTLAEATVEKPRDKAIVAWAGIVPDIDGAGYLVDLVTLFSEIPQTHYYEMFHRLWGHGLPAAFVVCLILLPWLYRRPKTLFVLFLSVHLHFLLDIVGSRGEVSGEIWPIYYLAPFTSELAVVSWSYQWPLGGWQNALFTFLLILFGLWRGYENGYSPISLFSARADKKIVDTLRNRFG